MQPARHPSLPGCAFFWRVHARLWLCANRRPPLWGGQARSVHPPLSCCCGQSRHLARHRACSSSRLCVAVSVREASLGAAPTMGWMMAAGCLLLAYSPMAAIILGYTARRSALLVLTIASAFAWLLAILAASLVWLAIPPLKVRRASSLRAAARVPRRAHTCALCACLPTCTPPPSLPHPDGARLQRCRQRALSGRMPLARRAGLCPVRDARR